MTEPPAPPGPPPPPRRRPDVFLLSSPRTLSNLLVKLLSQQPGWAPSGYHMHDAFVLGIERFSDAGAGAAAADRREYVGLLRRGHAALLADRAAAHEKGNSMFLKSHVCQIWKPSPLYEATKGGEYADELTLDDDDDGGGGNGRDDGSNGHDGSDGLDGSDGHEDGNGLDGSDGRHDGGNGLDGTTAAAALRTNPTLLSDEFLASFVPVFLVRHPVLVFDSWYRAEQRAGRAPRADLPTRAACYGLGPARALHDWYAARASSSSASAPGLGPGDPGFPLVLDADDVLDGGAVARLAAAVGMDPARVPRSWDPDPRPLDALDPLYRSYVEGIWRSTRVDASRTSRGLDPAAAHRRWRADHGPAVADALRRLADADMPHYEHMRRRRI